MFVRYTSIITDKLCDYGCKKPANFIFQNGKYCCSKHYLSCSSKFTKNKFVGFDNIDKIKCSYGCGGEAKYKSLIQKKYCCSKN